MDSADLLAIQADHYLCSHRGNCYISFREEFARDMSGNPNAPITEDFPGFIVAFFGHDIVRPQLLNFSLDFEEGAVWLTFNESVRALSLDPIGITVQGQSNTTNSLLRHTLTGGTTPSEDGTVIQLLLSPSDLSAIKASVFAKDENSTFLSITTDTITDNAYNPNAVVPIPGDAALQVSPNGLILDTTAPELTRYILDLDSDLLILTFNEPINQFSINCSEITLYNTSNGSEAYLPLSGCTVRLEDGVTGSEVITLELTAADIRELKVNLDFATLEGNTYLSFSSSAFVDTTGVAVVEVVRRQADSLIPDQTRSQLVSFTYDQHLGQINLTFSDIMDALTFDATGITLQHDQFRSTERVFTPSSATRTSSSNGYIIVVDLDHFDLLRLKNNTGVARNANDTFISIAAYLIDDTSGVDVVPITDGKAIQVATFVPDICPPSLVNYTMDMDEGVIILTFFDTINLTTFDPTGLVLQEFPNATAKGSVNVLRLGGGDAWKSEDGLTVTLQLLEQDLNEIKLNTNLSTETNNTFISLDSGSIYDLAGNALTAVPDAEAIKPAVFISDQSPPHLVSFDLDMDSRTLTLIFNETVNAMTLALEEISLQNGPSNPTQYYTLTSQTTSSLANDTTVIVSLSKNDVDAINRLRELASNDFNVFIVATSFAIQDMNNNNLYPIYNSSALPVSNFTRDQRHPELEEYDLDLDEGLLTLYFSEVMDYASLQPSLLTFISESDGSSATTNYTLTFGVVTPVDDITLYLYLDVLDLNEIKRLSLLAVDQNSTYLYYPSNLVTDTFNNTVLNRNIANAKRVTVFIFDSTPPVLVNFTLDVDQGRLNLTFNETVNASSFSTDAITFWSSRQFPIAVYTLQFSTSSTQDSTEVVVELDLVDLDAIKLRTTLATNESNTYLNLTERLVNDMNGIPFAADVHRGDLIPDGTDPELVDFVFDLNHGIIILNFTEAVNTLSLNVTALILYATNTTEPTNTSYRLQPSTVTLDSNGKIFNITLSDEDLNAIKVDYNLATEEENTYLAVEPVAILDMAGNYIVPLITPQMATDFILDTTSPMLTNATFNFNSGGVLLLTFSETVNADTFQPTQVTLQNDIPLPTSTLTLSGGSVTMQNSTMIELVLTESDLNLLKNISGFFANRNQAFVSLTNLTVQDMSGNYVQARPVETAFRLRDITNDNVSPDVVGFDLDVNRGLLAISFSETIDQSSFTVSNLWLRGAEVNGTVSEYRLSRQVSAVWNVTTVDVTLTPTDLDNVKLLEDLAIDNTTTFLRFNNLTASDTSGNTLTPLNNSQGIPVTLFTADTTPPNLEAFILDMDSPELLSLTFSEPIKADSVVFSSITLQSSTNASHNSTQMHTLSNGTVMSSNGRVISIELAFDDIVRIQASRSLAISDITTYISLVTGAMKDMNDVDSYSISMNDGKVVTTFIMDKNRPELVTFSADLNRGTLTLTFTETMDTASVAGGSYSLQLRPGDRASFDSIRYDDELNATSTNPLFADWYIIDITLNFTQLNEIKLLAPSVEGEFFTDNMTSYISILTTNSAHDTAGNDVVNIPDVEARAVSSYTPDTTNPVLTDFQLNAERTEAVITMVFSEPVLRDSLNTTLIEFLNTDSTNASMSTVVRLTGGMLLSTTNGLSLDLTLELDDFNLLKSLLDIATSFNDTYLFLPSGAVTDVYGNDISEEGGRTVQASNIRFDRTNPELIHFTFNVNSGTLSVTFTETVNASTFDPTNIILQSSRSAPLHSYQLTGGVGSTANQPQLMLNLTIEDLNNIKAIRELGTVEANTYIAVTPDVITDISGFNLTEIPTNDALMALTVIADSTSPTLLSFSLNLTTEELLLTFDETISVADTDLTQFILQSAPNSSLVTLSPASNVSLNDSTVIIISLSTSDLDRIKLDTTLAVSTDTTQLVLGSSAVKDIAGGENKEQVVNSTETIPDLVSPMLRTFIFDLNAGIALLNFDEAINTSSVEISALQFTDGENGSVFYTLSQARVNSTNGQRLQLILSDEDLNNIKRNTSLLTAISNSYLALGTGFVADMNGNQLVPVAAKMADGFRVDETSPVLTEFDLDMNFGHLKLRFSETVNASSFDSTGITLQSDMNSIASSSRYTLTGGYLLNNADDTELTLVIDTNDLNEIKSRNIARDNSTSWLAVTNATIKDLSSQLVQPRTDGLDTLNVISYTADTTSPQLLNFTLNLTSETLVLTFDETINVNSINLTQVTIQNTTNDPLSSHTLTQDSLPVLEYGPVVTVNLSLYDLNELKRQIYLATTETNTYLALTDEAVSDRAGNPVIAVPTNDSLEAHVVISDEIHPSLEDFEFDLNSGIITLSFSESILVSSINLTFFSLQNASFYLFTSGSELYTLRGGDVLSQNGPVVAIRLLDFDLNELKHNPNLVSGSGNETDNTFFSLTPSGVTDTSGNSVNEVPFSAALPAGLFISDTTRPELSGFDLNLDSGVVTLVFSEAVRGETLDATGITLRSLNTTNATSYSLTNGTFLLTEQTTLQVQITDYDLDNIKALLDLASTENNTYLDLREGTLEDTSGNIVKAVEQENAVAVQNLTRDTTSPRLVGFDLDLNSGEMNLTFSETVLAAYVDPSALTLQAEASVALTMDNKPLYYTLTNGTTSPLTNTILTLTLTNADLNELKRRPALVSSTNSTYLSLTSLAARDTSGNPILTTPSLDAEPVGNYTEDYTPPELLSFNLDLNMGQLILRFSETVNMTTLNETSLTFSSTCPYTGFMDLFNGTNSTNTTNPVVNYTITGN